MEDASSLFARELNFFNVFNLTQTKYSLSHKAYPTTHIEWVSIRNVSEVEEKQEYIVSEEEWLFYWIDFIDWSFT